MRLLVLFFVLVVGSSALAQTITDRDINRMRVQHEQNRTYQKSAKSKRLPEKFLEMEYEKPVLTSRSTMATPG